MQLDFHYYCIGALARMSGFSQEHAATIAYASQYVDDATESEPISVGDFQFDTVRTAHRGIRIYDWNVQKRIYIPFHFLPPKPIDSAGASFITSPQSDLAKGLWNRALSEGDGLLKLCFIGTALHTIADTTSHCNFSGRHNAENDVEGLCLFQGDEYNHLVWQNVLYDLLPQVGHAEAGAYPDLPFQKWKYKNHFGKEIIRNNPDEYLRAAERIFQELCALSPREDTIHAWDEISNTVAALLSNEEPDLEKRCAKWRNEFGTYFGSVPYVYDKFEWRKAALAENDENRVSWDKKEPSHFAALQFEMSPGFFGSSWANFHRAALRHRHYVLENLMP